MTEDAKDLLCKIGHETSLRYSIHLITAAALVAHKRVRGGGRRGHQQGLQHVPGRPEVDAVHGGVPGTVHVQRGARDGGGDDGMDAD